MIRYVKGVYSMNVNGGIVVEIQSGLGLEIFLPVNSPIYRYGEGETIKVYTSMIVKEDDIRLYGFHNRESLDLFEKLITVSGVGAKGAMSIVGTLDTDQLKRAVAFEDAKEQITQAVCRRIWNERHMLPESFRENSVLADALGHSLIEALVYLLLRQPVQYTP